MKLRTGDAAGALAAYEESLGSARKLAEDKSNAGPQRDLSVSLNNIGDLKLRAGDAAGALAAYEESLALRRKLAADKSNAEAQRDLAEAYAKLANVFRKLGQKAKALDALRQGRAVVTRMTELFPENAMWKRDLAWFDGQLAELAR